MIMKKNDIKRYILLTHTEDSIIEALSKNEFSSVSQLSKSIKIARTSIYNSLNTLVNKKMVAKNNFKYSLIDKELSKYESPILDPITQIKDLMYKILKLKCGDIVYSIESDNEISSLFSDKGSFLNWQKEVTKNGIVLKGIGSENALKYFKSQLSEEMAETLNQRSGTARFINTAIPGYCTIITFQNQIYFISRSKKYFYSIENEYVAEFMRGIIELIYSFSDYKSIT